MHFLRKNRQKRDRDAGLVFHWRGARKYYLGKVMALIMAVGLFSFAVYALKIEGLKPPLMPNREGVVIMLNEDDPYCRNLMMQVEERSPFPVRWDPAYDAGSMARIKGGVEKIVGAVWQYDAELLPQPVDKEEDDLASIIEPGRGLLGGMVDNWGRGGSMATVDEGVELPDGELVISMRVRAGGSLGGRFSGDELPMPVDLVEEDWLGQSFRFMLRVDEDGTVRDCLPLTGGTVDVVKMTNRQKTLAAWLRGQRFKRSGVGGGDAVGEVELQIEAMRE